MDSCQPCTAAGVVWGRSRAGSRVSVVEAVLRAFLRDTQGSEWLHRAGFPLHCTPGSKGEVWPWLKGAHKEFGRWWLWLCPPVVPPSSLPKPASLGFAPRLWFHGMDTPGDGKGRKSWTPAQLAPITLLTSGCTPARTRLLLLRGNRGVTTQPDTCHPLREPVSPPWRTSVPPDKEGLILLSLQT